MIMKKVYVVVFQKEDGMAKYTDVVSAKNFSEAVEIAKTILPKALRNGFRIKSIGEA